MNDLREKLKRPFPADRIHWRLGSTNQKKLAKETNNPKARATMGIPLAYIDARDVMARLDEVCGDLWQNRYTLADSGLLVCEIGIFILSMNEWVWRSNGAGDTQVEAEKGKASDAFKRAAVMWGIGRYLYSLDNKWVDLDQRGKFTPPPLPRWATPEGYDEIMKRRAA